ncbi:MAG: hypothetical protein MUC86_08495 [Burkholderiaceae bacterium]|nr:hypothetical protein [Burkholderiaceae bacterium]
MPAPASARWSCGWGGSAPPTCSSFAFGVPLGALGALLATVPATRAALTLHAHPEDTQRIVPAQAQTLLAFVLYALGAALGLLLT